VRWRNVALAIGTPAGVYRTGARSTTLAVNCNLFT